MTIGKRIKQRRLELKLSVDDLARKLGKDRSTIYRYERGDIERMPSDLLKPIANALRTTPQYLIGWEEAEEQAPKKTKDDIIMGDIIRSLRVSRNLSLAECSAELGIPLRELRRYEQGTKQPPSRTLNAIARFYGVEIVNMMEKLLLSDDMDEKRKREYKLTMENIHKWNEAFGKVMFTPEETEQMIQFGKFLIASRKQT